VIHGAAPELRNPVKHNYMQINACKNSTGADPIEHVSYLNVSEAVAALTPENLTWLERLAARRLRKLRTHPGLARYLAGKEPADLVDEALERLQAGSRRTKPKHIASHQTFLNHVQSVVNSLANNYTRHAEPHVNHAPLGPEEPGNDYVEPSTGEDVRRNVYEREWLQLLLSTLEPTASPEILAELVLLQESGHCGMSADQIVHQCSETLLSKLQRQVKTGGMEPLGLVG